MKWFIYIITILNIFLFSEVIAGKPNSNILIENLIKDSKPISFISWNSSNYLSTQDSTFDTFPQNLIKAGSQLYVFINGGGRLYKVINEGHGQHFKRVDSTINFGYNIGSFGFSYNERLYNLGGYGYWRMNGQLRIFNEKARQWDIVKLNKEIPILTGPTEGLIWYDVDNKKIYTAYYINRNEAIRTSSIDETQFIFDVMVLDLEKNEWHKLGILNKYLQTKIQNIKPLTMSPWGQIVSIGDKITLLDFVNNQILSLDVRKEYYQTLVRSIWGNSFYFKDSILFWGNSNKLDSLNIHYSDFISTNESLYLNESFLSKVPEQILYQYIPILFLAIVILLYLFKSYIFKKNVVLRNDFPLKGPNTAQAVFEEMEMQLLLLLINNSTSGLTTSTEEQNKVLGLVKKNPEIQKKQRSDIIIGINRKYSFVTKNDKPIIQKQRTEFDKRSFEYFIDYLRLDEIKSFLKENSVNP